jgi:cobyrinic acid a,c-diamide synthase
LCFLHCSHFHPPAGLAEQPPQPQAAGQQLPTEPAGLDGWLLSQDAVAACFHSMSSTADLSLVEGCVGMFDSPAADGSEAGSTAQVAAWLHLPVVLVIDAQAFHTPRSILALVRGYAAEDGSTRVAGLILNKALKSGLAAETQDALRQAGLDVAVLGSLPLVGVVLVCTHRQQDSSAQQQHVELLAVGVAPC